MAQTNLMRHRVNVWRPTQTQETAQTITGFTEVYESVPCFIQPASAAIAFWYDQRGTTVTHTVFTNQLALTFLREDVLEDANGNQYHLVSDPLRALQSNVYLQLNCEQYPEGAKLRLDVGEVP